MVMRIITFYTWSYSSLAKKLVSSGKKFGYRIKAIKIKEKGCWGYKVKHKPSIILKEYIKHGGNFLYLDVDTRILKPLGNLKEKIINNDLCFRRQVYGEGEYNLGVIGIGNNLKVLDFLKEWNKAVHEEFGQHETVDQKIFSEFIKNSNMQIYDLGRQYNFLPNDLYDSSPENAFIYHYKASRDNKDHDKWLRGFRRKIIDNTQY